jgi:hypothetical protein
MGISIKVKISLILAAVFIIALLSLVFAKTMAMVWTVIKILGIILPIVTAAYYFRKWGK